MAILGCRQGEATQRQANDIDTAARATRKAGIAARLKRTANRVERP